MSHRPAQWRGIVLSGILAASGILGPCTAALAADAGQVKTVRGAAWVERAGTRLPAQVGLRVQESDIIATGTDGSLGIVFADDSLLSIGPNTVLAIERFSFDPTTQHGVFESGLRTGTLAAVSGRLTRQSPGAMKVRTPSTILGVRGTEFLVRAGAAIE